jgi:hypothetical protein
MKHVDIRKMCNICQPILNSEIFDPVSPNLIWTVCHFKINQSRTFSFLTVKSRKLARARIGEMEMALAPLKLDSWSDGLW